MLSSDGGNMIQVLVVVYLYQSSQSLLQHALFDRRCEDVCSRDLI